MRLELSAISQLLMGMSKPETGNQYSIPVPTITKFEQIQTYSSDNSRTSVDDNEVIEFGPIKVKPRKRPAPTLATGRRSKYEILNPEEEQKRNVRRARNRAAAERVRISRLAIEQQLLDQIKQMEQDNEKLLSEVENLKNRKLHLETRIITHKQICANANAMETLTTSDDALNSYLTLNMDSSSYQLDEKVMDINFDDFLTEQNSIDSFVQLPNNDLEYFLMNV